jgi:biotin operon repressor
MTNAPCQALPFPGSRSLDENGRQAMSMRKDVREFIRRLEAAGLTVEPTPGHYRVFRDGKPLRKANGMPFTLPFSPDTTRWRRAAILDLRKLGIDVDS